MRSGVMSVSVFLLLLLLLLLLTDTRAKRQSGDEAAEESVYRARCASRCLSLHGARVATRSERGQVENNGSLGWCFSHKQCAKCIEPCKDTWDMKKKSQCRDLCERVFPRRHWECVTSCEFLRSVSAVKQGDCPPPDRASGFAAACVESCRDDRDCPAHRKCCSNGCGHTCQTPKNLYKGSPLKPRKDVGFRERAPGGLEVRWSSRFNVSAEPVVYVLQRRWNYGIQPSEDAATPWQVVAQSTEQAVWLADTRPGRWYQFRVAAVNVHGTRGFTPPSRHIHTNTDPSSPPAPSDLRVSNMTFGPGGGVRARLQWSMTSDLDVPVHHYKVSWSGAAPPTPPHARSRKTVRTSQVELDSLRGNSSYSVEVQAVSFWGPTQLRGPKATLHFSTRPPAASSPAPPVAPPPDILDVGTPFYQDGQLRVRVYWQSSTDPSVVRYRVQWGPEYCAYNHSRPTEKITTQESFASLPDLLFSCKYKVLLQPISSRARPQAESTSFFTPSCSTIQAKSPKPIVCSHAGSPAVLARAENLTAWFEARGDNVTAVFRWDVSSPRPAPRLTGYQVTWTEVTSSSSSSTSSSSYSTRHGHNNNNNNNLPHSLVSQSQILPPENSVLVVSGLRVNRLYRLEVQVLGAGGGEGPATTRTFRTPGLHDNTLPHSKGPRRRDTPPGARLRKHHQRQPIIERH